MKDNSSRQSGLYVNRVKICRDESRSQGYCYAKIELCSKDSTERKLEKSLEVILNGTGINKALRKVSNYLKFQGIPVPENLRELIKPYQGP